MASCITRTAISRRAVELIGKATALRPDVAAYHSNLAEAHRALGDYQQAVRCCRQALVLQPDYPEAANNLGLALQSARPVRRGREQFRAALQMRPDFAMAQNNLGVVLRELGQGDEALDAFRAAVALEPHLAQAQANLGQLLLDRGQAEEALLHCQEAVRLAPTLPAGHNNLGNAFRALERWDEARAAYGRGAASGPRPGPRPRQPRPHPATAKASSARRSIASARPPHPAPTTSRCGTSWPTPTPPRKTMPPLLPCCERLIALRPELALGHNELGSALHEEGRLSEAAACYARALELQPNHLDALLSQGELHEEQGELARAEACYRQAQTAHPDAPAAAGPAGDLAPRQTARRRPRSPAAPAGAARELADEPRCTLLFGLAHVHDARGEYADAAACLARANALSLQLRRRQGKTYDPAAHRQLVDRIIAGFTPELFRRLRGAGDPTRLPVFVFGMPRSGTTLVEQVLASHSQVYGAGELRLARQGFESIPDVLGMPDDMAVCLNALDGPAVGTLSRRHREGLQALLPRDGVARVVDKMPDNYLYLGLLALLFPEGDVPPRPPRPARRGHVVLDDQLPQHPLGQRHGPPGGAHSPTTGG